MMTMLRASIAVVTALMLSTAIAHGQGHEFQSSPETLRELC
jgi:hypothetical protein